MKLLREIRDGLCLSQEFFARCLKIDTRTLAKLEGGELDGLLPELGNEIERRLRHLGWWNGPASGATE